MQMTKAGDAAGEGDVEWRLADVFFSDESRRFLFERFLEAITKFVERVANLALLLLRYFFQTREESGYEAGFSAEIPHANFLE